MVNEMVSGRCLWKYKETYRTTRHQFKPDISCGDSRADGDKKCRVVIGVYVRNAF